MEFICKQNVEQLGVIVRHERDEIRWTKEEYVNQSHIIYVHLVPPFSGNVLIVDRAESMTFR